MVLHISWVELQPSIEHSLETRLRHSNARYPIKKIQMRSLACPPTMRNYAFNNFITGPLPTKVIIGIVKHKSSLGDIKESAFDFKFHNLTEINLVRNGLNCGVPFTIEAPTASRLNYKCARAYQALCEENGANNDSSITMSEFQKDSALFCYDLTNDRSGSDHSFVNPTDHGTLNLNLEFSTNLAEALNVIVLAEFNNEIQIDQLRNIILDY
jgi:hypothetical protein